MKKDWIDILREKLKTYEEPAPENLWERIEEQMTTVSNVQKSRPLFPLWSRVLLTTAAVLLVAFILIDNLAHKPEVFINPENPEVIALLDSIPINDMSDSMVATEKVTSNTKESHTPKKASSNGTAPSSIAPKSLTQVEVKDEASETPNTNSSSANAKVVDSSEEPLSKSVTEETATRDDTPKAKSNTQPYQPFSQKVISTRAANKLSVNLYAKNAPTQRDTKVGYGRGVAQLKASSKDEDMFSAKREVMFFNQNKEIKKETRHSLPISFGLTASYSFSKRLSIESGLTYTYLSSKTSQGTEESYLETSHQQHLIGLPIILKYSIYHTKNFDLYASTGGAIERAIISTSRTKYMINHTLISEEKNPNDAGYFIWSVQGAVGIRYNVFKNTGLYLEPGISYHFTREGLTESIYTQQPLNFNLTLGLNFQF